MGAYAELFERGAEQRPDEIARVLRGVRVRPARMQALIEDLLLLVRASTRAGRSSVSPSSTVVLAAEAVEAAQMIGRSGR